MAIGGLYKKMSDPTNLELLRLATELAYADYNNRRANLHNQWLVDNDKMKRMYGTTVPYPTIPPYPTEEEIVAKAQTLIKFLSAPRPDLDNKQLAVIDVEEEKDMQIVSEEQLNVESTDIPDVVKKTKKNRDVAVKEKQKTTPSNISEELNIDEKSSIIEKIKTVWR